MWKGGKEGENKEAREGEGEVELLSSCVCGSDGKAGVSTGPQGCPLEPSLGVRRLCKEIPSGMMTLLPQLRVQ